MQGPDEYDQNNLEEERNLYTHEARGGMKRFEAGRGKGEREWCLLKQNQSPKIASRITHIHLRHHYSQRNLHTPARLQLKPLQLHRSFAV